MKMAMKKWSTAAAASVAFAMAGSAHAAIQAGFDLVDSLDGTEGAELFLAVWDVNAPKTYVQDLGIDASLIDWATYSNTFTIDSTVFGQSQLGTSAPADLRFALFAAVASNDFLSAGLWSTAAPGDTNDWFAADPVINFGSAITNLDDLSNAHNTTLASPETYSENVATQGNSGSLVIPGLAFTGFFVDGAGVASPTGSSINDALQWFEITWENGQNSNLLRETWGNWTASVSGSSLLSVSYSPGGAPIPLPAGVWLLGSALVGLAGVARRRAVTAN